MKDPIDEKIKAALTEEDRRVLADLEGEMSLPSLVSATFKGRWRFLNIMVWGAVAVHFGFAVYCAFAYFSTDVLTDRLTYATGFLFFTIAIVILKLWVWMDMNKIALERDIRRLEMRILVNDKA